MTVTYSLTDSASGKFSLDTDTIKVASTPVAGSASITVRATDANGWTKDKTFTIMTSHVASADDSYMLYVAGQSNASAEGGTGTPSGFVSDSNIKIWNNSAWETYAPGSNSMGNNNSGTQWWGSEVAFAMQWRLDNPTKTLYIVKHAVGGTGLGPTSDPTWDNTVSASLYDALKAKSVAAKAALTGAALVPIPFAFFWSVGETPDAGNETYAANYATKAAALFAAVRADMVGSNAMILCSRIGHYTPNATYPDGVSAGQISAVAGSQPAAIVSARVESAVIDDGYHYKAAGVLSIGQRAYGEALGSVGFADKLDAATSATVTSETLTIRNIIGSSLPVTVSGCTWSKNGGAYSSSAGTVTNFDTVAIQAVASASNFTATNPSITIGNATLTKRILTLPAVGTGLDGTESDGTGIYNTGGPNAQTGYDTFVRKYGAWVQTNATTINPNMAVAPNGLVEAAEIRVHNNGYQSSLAVFCGNIYTFNSNKDYALGATKSVYVKPGENGSERYIVLGVENGAPNTLYLFIDTQTWTVSDTARNANATTAGDAITSSSIQDALYGYKKITLNFTLTPDGAGGGGYTQFRHIFGMSQQATLAAAQAVGLDQGRPAAAAPGGLKHIYIWRPKVT